MDWSGVDYLWIIVMFLSAVWTLNLTAPIHSLQRIHCWVSDGMLYFSKSVLMKKQTHLHLEWPEGEDIFSKFLGWTISFILLLIKWERSHMLLFFVTDWVKISCSTCLNCHWWVSVESEHGCPLSLQQSSHLLCSPCSMTRQVSFACPALPLQSLCVIGSEK